MHLTTVPILHKGLHPIKGTGAFKTWSWMEDTWVTNHHVVLTANMCQGTHSCECFYETFMLKVEKMRWLWVVMILTFWVDIRDFLLTQRGKPAPKCPCVIGVLSTSIPVWWCWDVKTLMPHILENPRSGGSLSKMFLPLDFSFGWRFPPKDTAEARAEREVHEAATKKLWWLDENTNHWIGLKFLDKATISVEGSFSFRLPQDLFSSLHPISLRGSC